MNHYFAQLLASLSKMQQSWNQQFAQEQVQVQIHSTIEQVLQQVQISTEKKQKPQVRVARYAVDSTYVNAATRSVYIDESTNRAWSCVLNQTNIAANNNKFYIIQLLRVDDSNYEVFARWGRVWNTLHAKLFVVGGTNWDASSTIRCLATMENSG